MVKSVVASEDDFLKSNPKSTNIENGLLLILISCGEIRYIIIWQDKINLGR